MIKSCEYCEKEFNAERSKIRFCSTACGNKSRGKHSDDTKNKISSRLKKYYETHDSPIKDYNMHRETSYRYFSCPFCKTEVKIEKWKTNKTCKNKSCISANRSKNTGGYREGSGRSKAGYYNGIYCGSTYELVWIMFNDAHDISYKRFEGFIEYGDGKKYFPDFIQGNKIIEIKGFHTEMVDIKKDATVAAGYEIEILYKEDLKPMFDWFKKTQKGNSLVEMYDNHKPKFEYTCSCCNVVFGSEKQRKTELKYCSNTCAGKHRAQIRHG